jgi:hypothetical protein
MKIKILFYLKNGFKVSTHKIGLEDICDKSEDGKFVYKSDDGQEYIFESVADLITVFSNMIDGIIKTANPYETVSFGTTVVLASEISAYKFKIIKDKTPAPEDLVTVEYQ